MQTYVKAQAEKAREDERQGWFRRRKGVYAAAKRVGE